MLHTHNSMKDIQCNLIGTPQMPYGPGMYKEGIFSASWVDGEPYQQCQSPPSPPSTEAASGTTPEYKLYELK